MRDILNEIIALQSEYSADNTPSMSRRGILVRKNLRASLEALEDDLAQAIGISTDDLIVEGRDGTGQKSKVPWTRFGSQTRAPSANSGWYIVFLFRPQGDGVYLCLSHAATIWNGTDYVPRPDTEMIPLMNWARDLLEEERDENNLIETIDLAKANRLASSYERSTALAQLYLSEDLPDDDALADNVRLFGAMLGRIYGLEDKGLGPNEVHYQREVAQKQIRHVESGRNSKAVSQGFGLSGPERRVVELRAMEVAREWLVSEGYKVKDVSATDSCDYLATKSRVKIFVEVKGTTGQGLAVNLTKNEVALHKAKYPNTMLLIVSRIDLDKAADPPIATGGTLKVTSPWKIIDEQLTALSYQYLV